MFNKVYNDICNYIPTNEQEENDKKEFIWLLDTYKEKAFERSLLFGHITASAIIIDKEYKKMLMCFHNIYKSWAWLGGHADGEMDLYKLILEEIKEESGLEKVELIGDGYSSLEILSHINNTNKPTMVALDARKNCAYLRYDNDIKGAVQLEEIKEYVVTEPKDIREWVQRIVPTYSIQEHK